MHDLKQLTVDMRDNWNLHMMYWFEFTKQWIVKEEPYNLLSAETIYIFSNLIISFDLLALTLKSIGNVYNKLNGPLIKGSIYFFFQNEEIFVQLDQLDELDRITQAWIGSIHSLTQAQKTF